MLHASVLFPPHGCSSVKLALPPCCTCKARHSVPRVVVPRVVVPQCNAGLPPTKDEIDYVMKKASQSPLNHAEGWCVPAQFSSLMGLDVDQVAAAHTNMHMLPCMIQFMCWVESSYLVPMRLWKTAPAPHVAQTAGDV